jgi:pyruvate/2-oxoglutarate dehydrogenase complex dihydrolipoamide dehydrogenase (E3) component
VKKGEGIYNVVVIGGGTAGLVTAAGTVGLGGRVALIERNKMGGDCLNFGCVPSKALISSARLIQQIRDSEKWGLDRQSPQFVFEKIFERMRARRAKLAPIDSQERFESLGVDVFRGEARFVSPNEIEVFNLPTPQSSQRSAQSRSRSGPTFAEATAGERGALGEGQKLRARNFVIATGSRAFIPKIDGIDQVPYFINETIFDELQSKPESMIVLGGGPIGCELGQAFSRLGVKVTILQSAAQILPPEDVDVAKFMQERLEAEGVEIRLNAQSKRIEQRDGKIVVQIDQAANVVADLLLVAAGRTPNLRALNLEAAGVRYNERGVEVNDYLQTSQPHIYAAGDIANRLKFTHMADFTARAVVRNILMPFQFLRQKVSGAVVPWCTYTDPEVGHVGLGEKDARQKNVDYDLFVVPLEDVDRAVVENEDIGFAKVLAAKGSDKILGATIVGPHAGDLLHEFVLAMNANVGLGKIAATIHAYPTLAELARKAGDKYNKTRLTPRAKKILSWMYRRRL